MIGGEIDGRQRERDRQSEERKPHTRPTVNGETPNSRDTKPSGIWMKTNIHDRIHCYFNVSTFRRREITERRSITTVYRSV